MKKLLTYLLLAGIITAFLTVNPSTQFILVGVFAFIVAAGFITLTGIRGYWALRDIWTWLTKNRCSRCRKKLKILHPSEAFTAGYYVASGWPEFTDKGEVYVCDPCMWADPRYIKIYGHHNSTTRARRGFR